MVFVFGLLMAFIVAVFALQNSPVVPVRFMLWSFEISLVYVILGSAASGALVVAIMGLIRQLGTGRRLKAVTDKLRKAEEELQKARASEAMLQEQKRALEEEKENFWNALEPKPKQASDKPGG